MASRLSLQHLPGETRAFLERDGRLTDLVIEREGTGARLGDRFVGRVGRLDRRLSAAFVELGVGPQGLLPLNAGPPGLSEGDCVAVAVTRIAFEDKGPRLAAVKDAERVDGAPRRLADGLGAVEGLLAGGPDEVVTDHPAMQRRLRGGGYHAGLLLGGFSQAESAAFDAAVEGLLAPAAALPGGGNLLIESGRTLTAVDVNVGARDAMPLEVNRAAALELVRQLRLRSIGGRILIDFLENGDGEVRQATEAALKAAFADDPERVKFVGWSRGGLFELTRRRSRPALGDLLLESTPEGWGMRKRADTLAFEALRAYSLASRGAPGTALLLAAAPVVAEALRSLPALWDLEDRLGQTVELEARPSLAWREAAFTIETSKG